MKTTVIIPSRYESSRFPGKPLVNICGKPMIQHVYERCLKAKGIYKVIVATDNKKIFNVVTSFGGEAVFTSLKHPTGTDRIAEAALNIDSDIIINVQGDEPQIEPEMICKVANPFFEDKTLQMATLATEIKNGAGLSDPNTVKVVMDKRGFALYFSRHSIPFNRDSENFQISFFKQMGIYAFRKKFLLNFVKLSQTPLEQTEKLEQLRALEHGFNIKVVKTNTNIIGVDTPEDLEKVIQSFKTN